MTALDVADLVVIAGQALGIGSDAALRQIDLAAAQAALAEASQFDRPIPDQQTAAAAGIRLIDALLRHRPFAQHGERLAVAAGLQFLALNGWRAHLDPPATTVVVVEALATGQLSPSSAAAWLSPRLAADRPQPAPRAQRMPLSVSYPQALLFLQAACWALGAAGSVYLYIAAMASGRGETTAALVILGWAPVSGGLAAAKFTLGRRVGRGRSKQTRQVVIATEIAMTCFGLTWLAVPAYGLFMPGVPGAALSLAAVLCMTRPSARQHFSGADSAPGAADSRSLPDPASFWRLTPPPGPRLAVI